MLRRILLIAIACLTLTASVAGAQDTPTPTTVPAPVDEFTPLDEYNYASHPISAYDLGWSNSQDGTLGVLGLLLALPWDASRYIVAGSLWFVGWVFDAEIAHTLAGPAADLSQAMNASLIEGLDLRGLAFFVLALIIVTLLIAGRPGRAFGEALEVLIVLIGGSILVANLGGVMEGAANGMSTMTGAAFSSISGSSGVEPVQGAMQRSLIEAPWEIVNWGRPLRPECRAAADKILTEQIADAQSGMSAYDVLGDAGKVGLPGVVQGPAGAVAAATGVVASEVDNALSTNPREVMKDAGCEREANHNAVPGTFRIFSSVLNLLFVILAAGLLLITATAVAVAQVGVIGVLYMTPFIVIGGLINRGIVSWFVTQVAMYFGLAIGASLAMVFHLGMLLAVMSISSPMAIYGRWALATVVTIAGVVFFRRIIGAFRTFSVVSAKRGAVAAVGPSKVLTSRAAADGSASYRAMLGWQEGAAGRAKKRVHDTKEGVRTVGTGALRTARGARTGAVKVGKISKGAAVGASLPLVGAAALGGAAAAKAPGAARAAARAGQGGVRKARALPQQARDGGALVRSRATAAVEMAGVPTGATRRRSDAAAKLAAVMAEATGDAATRHEAVKANLEAPKPAPPPLYVNSAWEEQWAGSMDVGADEVVAKREKLRAAKAVRDLMRPPADTDIDPTITGPRRERILGAMDQAWDRKMRHDGIDPIKVREARSLEIEHDDYAARILGDQLRNVGRVRGERRVRRDGGIGEAPPETKKLEGERSRGGLTPGERSQLGRGERSA